MSIRKLKVQSVALYGSHARREADLISDSDLLIVDSDPTVLSEASTTLCCLGFSCATYTWQRLSRLAAHGSLFLQHLKSESLILKDVDARLENFLESFKPKPDYSHDIDATRELVALTEFVSGQKATIGWACDVLAVAVRNIGILEIANRGQYAFSMAAIYDKLVDFGILTNSDVQTLLPLRLYKSLYRSRRYQSLPALASLKAIQRTISRRFRVDFCSKVLSPGSITSEFIRKSETHHDKYCRLRLLEGGAISYIDRGADLPPEAVRRFNRLIKNHNHYGLFWHDLSVPLRNAVMDIINH
jgi:hypothetical protein